MGIINFKLLNNENICALGSFSFKGKKGYATQKKMVTRFRKDTVTTGKKEKLEGEKCCVSLVLVLVHLYYTK